LAIENLPNLIEDCAARDGVAARKLWSWALDAIDQGVLRPILPEGQTLDTEFSHGGMPLTLRKIVLRTHRAIERYIPSKDEWAKTLMFDATEFDNWLKRFFQAQSMPAHPKRPAGRKPNKRERVASFIKQKYPKGVPAGITGNAIARQFEAKHKVSISERTVRRALGRA
jgi:hypothetical protein